MFGDVFGVDGEFGEDGFWDWDLVFGENLDGAEFVFGGFDGGGFVHDAHAEVLEVADEGKCEVICCAGAGDEAVGGFDVAAFIPNFAWLGDGFDDFEVFCDDMAQFNIELCGDFFEAAGMVCFKPFFFYEDPNFHDFWVKKKGATQGCSKLFLFRE